MDEKTERSWWQKVGDEAGDIFDAAKEKVKAAEGLAAQKLKEAEDFAIQKAKDAEAFVEQKAKDAKAFVEQKAKAVVAKAGEAKAAVVEKAKEAEAFVEKEVQAAKEELKSIEDGAGKLLKEIENDPSLALNDTSGGRGSAVANPNPPEALSGGGTASAGDSAFVTGEQKSTLLKKSSAIQKAASGIYDAESALERQAKDDQSLLDSLKNMKGIADGMVKLAHAIDSVKGDENAGALGKADKVSEVGDTLIGIADKVLTVQDANGKLKAFQDHPNKETAEAWARSVGDVFDKAADLVPSKGLPGFIPAMWKGLLSAPKSYINAFITLQNVYYGNIDKEAGLTGPGIPLIGRNATKKMGEYWQGDMTDMFGEGWFIQQRNKKKQSFCDFMTAHRKSGGMDLWKSTMEVGKAVLLAAINRELEEEDPAKDVWISHVGKF